jgi:hypothetical protein
MWTVSSYWSYAVTVNRNDACFGMWKEMEEDVTCYYFNYTVMAGGKKGAQCM